MIRSNFYIGGAIWVATLAFACLPRLTVAQVASTPSTSPAVPSIAADAQPRKNVEQRLGMQVDSVTPSPYAGLYEVRAGDKVVYTDAQGNYLIVGKVIDLRTHEDLTAKRQEELADAALPKVNISDLPLGSAIKIVRGNGKRTAVVFEDPNCVFCKRLEKSLDALTDVTLYVFLYPILGPDSVEKSKAIWCSADRSKTWTDWMSAGTAIPASKACDNPIAGNLALGEKLKVSGTPTMIFPGGKRIPGAVAPDVIVRQLALQ